MSEQRKTRIRIFGITAGIGLLLGSYPVAAQLVSVQCCTVEADFENIESCVGGSGIVVRPPQCAPAATCILGFGPDLTFVDQLCAKTQGIPVFDRGFCSSWNDESIPVVHLCEALPEATVTMFEVFDDEQDGDLDAADIAVFHEVYDGVPKLIQSESELTSVECCIPSAMPSELADCLSGPGNTNEPPNCAIEPVCTAGFTAPLEPGDWLYKTCAQIQDESEPIPPLMYCQSWQTPPLPPAFECRAAHLPGHSLFVIADLDGDEDVDLADYAAIQRSMP